MSGLRERVAGEPILIALLGVFALLALASALTAALSRRSPGASVDELRARIRSWWWMAGVFTLALLSSRGVSLAFMGLLSFLALKEYLSLIPTRRADRSVLIWAYLAIPVQYLWVAVDSYGMFIVFIPVYMLILLPVRMVLIGETEGFLKAAGTLHWGLMMTVFSLSHLAFLLRLPAEGAGGPGLVLFLVLLTELNDVAQFVFGRWLGRHPVTPRVSPKKTYEGLFGGLLVTVALSLALATQLTPLTRGEALGAGVLIGLGGFLGDVTVSAVKRDIGVKDSGTLLPGHGGILDRVDSLTFTAPLFFHYLRYLHF